MRPLVFEELPADGRADALQAAKFLAADGVCVPDARHVDIARDVATRVAAEEEFGFGLEMRRQIPADGEAAHTGGIPIVGISGALRVRRMTDQDPADGRSVPSGHCG